MKAKKLQREIDHALLKLNQWTLRLNTLRSLQAAGTQRIDNSLNCDLLDLPSRTKAEDQVVHPAVLAPYVLANVRRGRRYGGLYMRVGRKLQVNTSKISAVALGRKVSARISAALTAEVALMDAEPWRPAPENVLPFQEDVYPLFLHGQKYFGVLTKVAKQLGISYGGVSGIARGKSKSERVLEALRTEMARVDAEIAAKEANANG